MFAIKAVELRDYIAFIAIVISLVSFFSGRSDRKRGRQLSFEQKRQELMIVRNERLVAIGDLVHKLHMLEQESRLKLRRDEAGDHDVTRSIKLSADQLDGGLIFDRALALSAGLAPAESVTHEKMLKLEEDIGEAKRALEKTKEKARSVEQYIAERRAYIESIAPRMI